ncbi:uncharacterized protein LOC34623109 [Cyclospora cayetanensis]|uniref:Nodulation protein E n=1 Tax=Cyclospora cayetanensis TaxID=88456 RepID=A0A6P6RW21_9EIME|nr:uncharacterized protein LOC34623109 [Cyclospora cayetanensis]
MLGAGAEASQFSVPSTASPVSTLQTSPQPLPKFPVQLTALGKRGRGTAQIPAFVSRSTTLPISPKAASQASVAQAHAQGLQQQQPRSASDFLRARADRSSRLFSQYQGGGQRPRILCTGLGVVSAAGIGVERFWENLLKGQNNAATVSAFDPKDMACTVAYEIPSEAFDPKQYFREPKDAKRNDRYTHFAVAASKLALQDAGLDSMEDLDMNRFGVIIGSGIGGLGFMEQQNKVLLNSGPRRVSPYLIPAMIANTAPAQVAIEIGAKGPNHGAVSACATSGHAIGTAMRLLEAGDADIVLCGGAEASITPLSFAGFNALKALALGFNDRPKEACRPFDKDRAGFVMGEGAGVIVLETEEHAVRRGATQVYGQLAGYGATCDAHHMTAPSPEGEGLARCMNLALRNAGVAPEDVGYINAHGTSTHYNDKFETKAIKKVFGPHATKLLISSTKPMTGHCLGGTAGIETVVAAKVLQTGDVPPTLNYRTPDPECDLNYVPNQAVHVSEPMKAVLTDTLGFGGHNAALVLTPYRKA